MLKGLFKKENQNVKEVKKMKKIISTGVIVFSLVFLLSLPAKATTYAYLDFDGDAAFPSLSWQYNTAGLAPFTGSAFRAGGFSATDMTTVQTNIINLLNTDYAPYDISFVTSTAGLSSWVTWGIDDSAYAYSVDGGAGTPLYPNPMNPYAPCPESAPHYCARLFGKATNNPGDIDQDGNNIYNPTYARTWAGSLALGAGTASPSSPSLFGASLADISQALGNSAAHEIAHIFGVGHPLSYPGPGDLMWVEIEGIESTVNKTFSSSDRAILMNELGPRIPEPSTLLLLGSGLVGLAFARRRMKR